MKTRAEIEEILATQRANRRNPSPAAPYRKGGRDLLGVLAVIVILCVSGAAMFFAVQWTAPKPEGTATTSPSASPLTTSTSTNTAPDIMPTPVAMMVCTEIPDGWLHVRFAAGDGSEVRGYLTEGEAVQVALGSDDQLDSQIIKDNLWVRISFPVAGWVNARYLCKSE